MELFGEVVIAGLAVIGALFVLWAMLLGFQRIIDG